MANHEHRVCDCNILRSFGVALLMYTIHSIQSNQYKSTSYMFKNSLTLVDDRSQPFNINGTVCSVVDSGSGRYALFFLQNFNKRRKKKKR